MTWGHKRQISYILFLLIILTALGYFFIIPYFNKTPTCSDGKQNGIETGIDCGGNCILACENEVDQVSILWSRIFKVVDGRYNAVVYLENLNENNAVYKVKYKFRFADKNNIYIGSRTGEAYIPPRGKFAIFEPAIGVGNSVPIYTSFEFIEKPIWVQVDPEKNRQLKIITSNIVLENEDTSPKLSALISNKSLFSVPNIKVITILYDEAGNAVNASSTVVDILRPEEKNQVIFTWPLPFESKVISKEIIPIYNIFDVSLK